MAGTKGWEDHPKVSSLLNALTLASLPCSNPVSLPVCAAWLGVAPQRECLYPESQSGQGHLESLPRLPVAE